MVGTTCDTITGYCAGANICIEGHCGAVLSHLEAPESNPRSVTLSAPLMNVSSLYVVVGDFQSDAYAPGISYNVNVRVAEEPDTHEPSEFFSGIPPTEDDQMSAHHPFATAVTVHDCGTDCCEGNPANWVEGYLSYTYDQDWYSYEHPCPEEDCMVAVHYELAAGPVDFLLMVSRWENDVWIEFDPPSDTGNSPARSNKYGGTAAGDECFFAHNMHEDYFFVVRDTVWVSESNPRGGLWDASKDQSYRFCIEKIADGCVSPCRTADDGSGCTLDP
jgi:hypothetical protein